MEGYVYLLQPELVLNTNKYKIGCAGGNTLKRIKCYGKNSIIYITYRCNNYVELEKKLIKEFKTNYKLIQGNEYFEGNIINMKKSFIYIINNNEENMQEKNELQFEQEKIKQELKSNKINKQDRFLDISINIIKWFKENFISTNYQNDMIRITDMYIFFLQSEYYLYLITCETQKYIKNIFYKCVKENIFFKDYYYEKSSLSIEKYIKYCCKKSDN